MNVCYKMDAQKHFKMHVFYKTDAQKHLKMLVCYKTDAQKHFKMRVCYKTDAQKHFKMPVSIRRIRKNTLKCVYATVAATPKDETLTFECHSSFVFRLLTINFSRIGRSLTCLLATFSIRLLLN